MAGVEVLTIRDPDYPYLLKYIDRPPSVLYRQGVRFHALAPIVSIVGTLEPSTESIKLAGEIAQKLSRQGFLIASGLARGIDTSAHIGALKAGGRTIAVVGSGLKRIYPKQNINLAREIVQNGAILSEYGEEEPVSRWRLVQRNRIIAGLSLAIIVIEPDKGSLHTVRWALKYNRFVFRYQTEAKPDLGNLQMLIRMKAFHNVAQILELVVNLYKMDVNLFEEDRQLSLFPWAHKMEDG